VNLKSIRIAVGPLFILTESPYLEMLLIRLRSGEAVFKQVNYNPNLFQICAAGALRVNLRCIRIAAGHLHSDCTISFVLLLIRLGAGEAVFKQVHYVPHIARCCRASSSTENNAITESGSTGLKNKNTESVVYSLQRDTPENVYFVTSGLTRHCQTTSLVTYPLCHEGMAIGEETSRAPAVNSQHL